VAPARQLGGAKECGRGGGRSRRGCGSIGLVSGTAIYGRDRGCGRTSLGARGWTEIGAHRGGSAGRRRMAGSTAGTVLCTAGEAVAPYSRAPRRGLGKWGRGSAGRAQGRPGSAGRARTYGDAGSGAWAGGAARTPRHPRRACCLGGPRPREGVALGGALRLGHGPAAPCTGSARLARATSRRRGVTSAGWNQFPASLFEHA
jgi:hypothetical protein